MRISDWSSDVCSSDLGGGVSPLTPDHVNPEAPWPHLDRLADDTARAGCDLVERLTVYPSYVRARDEWLAPALQTPVLRLVDGAGLARVGRWSPGAAESASADDLRDVPRQAPARRSPITQLIARASIGREHV